MPLYKCLTRVGEVPNESYSSSICGMAFCNMAVLRAHINKVHDDSVRKFPTLLLFKNWNAFDRWLAMEVHKVDAPIKYVSRCQQRNPARELIARTLSCFRAGKCTEAVDRKRAKKRQGSCKMNGPCTSEIIAKLNEYGLVEVHYYEDHYPHSRESSVRHMRMGSEMKRNILDLAKKNVPNGEIAQLLKRGASDDDPRSMLNCNRVRNVIKTAEAANRKLEVKEEDWIEILWIKDEE